MADQILESEPKALWASRFSEGLMESAHRFSSSIEFDKRFFEEDIEGSIAHVQMLGEQEIITSAEATIIENGLREVLRQIHSEEFRFTPEMEDVHLAIESKLIEIVGPVGGKLHTGRSRNDQVALDERLFLRKAIVLLQNNIHALQSELLEKAEDNLDVILPGYTHMQRAQPIAFSHHLLAYVEMLGRDYARLQDCFDRLNVSPLGAAALAGTSFPIDRERVAKKLQFAGVVRNSIDAVSDRDYAIELASDCSIVMMHLSRMAEELVLWSTREFGFIQMSDRVTTGSSIMPQKKNPDMAELVRGKTGRVYGDLINLLTIMKGLPLAYNRDMQEDKQPMFDAVDTANASLEITRLMLQEMTVNKDRMLEALQGDMLTATEIADYLVTKGLPFRSAHHVAGKLVTYALQHECTLEEIPLAEFKRHSELFEEDIFNVLNPGASIANKRSAGSTSPASVQHQIEYWKSVLK